MKLRILGVNNMSSRDTTWPVYVIDGVLALDAGGLARSLTFDEQAGIQAVVLSHRHIDHTLDLVPFALNGLVYKWPSVDVYGIQDTVDYLRTGLFGNIVPDFLSARGEEGGVLDLNVIDFYKQHQVLEYSVTAVPVPHAVPAAGLQIESEGVRLFYTGDAGRGLSEAWAHVSPDVLLTECTHGNENRDHALRAGHLTPDFLKETLLDFKARHEYLPRVLVTHINPPWGQAVRRELIEVSRELDHEILIATPGLTLDLGR